MKRRLTDRTLQSLKRSQPGERYEVMDVETRGLGVRVNDKGTRSFIFIGRFPGSKNPARRHLGGEYPSMTLSEARQRAREWRELLAVGKDPRVEQERRQREEARRQGNTFESVCEDYFTDIKRRGLRRAHEVERDMRREFVARWAKRPIGDISRHDVLAVIDAAIKRGAPWQAHHLFAYASRLFGFAIERGMIENSPCERLRPSRIIGAKEPRTRVLTDHEMRLLWTASDKVGYPFGPLVRMLMLTGQRRSEVGEARWSEFDFDKKLWSIPVARMKARAAHVVPLTDDVITLLKDLPRFAHGDYLFTTTFGAKAVNGFSKMKARLDEAMHKVEPYVLHDIRRTVRTHLSALPIPDLVRELVIGHTKPGLHKVYDQHAYIDEKRHALELWAKRLRDIVEPPPKNIVALRKGA